MTSAPFAPRSARRKSPVRRLERLAVMRRGDWVLIEATANAFLHHMVRNIAGLLIAVGKGDASPDWAAEVLAGCDRTRAAATAPAAGLYLVAVRYPAGVRPARAARRRGAGARSAMIGVPRNRRHASERNRCPGSKRSCPPASRPSGARARCPRACGSSVPACDAVLYRAELERNLYVCPKCSHHMRMGARERLRALPRPGHDRGDRREHLARGPAEVPRQQALPRPPGCRRRRRPAKAMR